MRGGGLSPSPSSLVLAALLAVSHLATVHSGGFIHSRAANEGYAKIGEDFTITVMEKEPTMQSRCEIGTPTQLL